MRLETPKDFLTFFAAIPEQQWLYGSIGGAEGRRCALGHIGVKTTHHLHEWPTATPAAAKLFQISQLTVGRSPWAVNDGLVSRGLVPGVSPKERICNMLVKACEVLGPDYGLMQWAMPPKAAIGCHDAKALPEIGHTKVPMLDFHKFINGPVKELVTA